MAQEETHWKKKSRVSWLRDGDKNTKVFKLSTLNRRSFNRISEIKTFDESITDDMEIIKKEEEAFFSIFLVLIKLRILE